MRKQLQQVIEKKYYKFYQNNNSEIEKIYRDYYPRIFAYVYAKKGDYELAEDIAQQAFLNALVYLNSYHLAGINFSPWLYKIAHNLLVSHFRWLSTHHEVPLEEIDSMPVFQCEDVEYSYLRTEEHFELKKTLKNLSNYQQTVLKLRYIYGLSIVDTAFLLNKSISWVKVVQHRAIKRLRLLLAREAT